MPRISLDIEQVRQLPQTHAATIPEEFLDAMGHMNVMWYTHLFSVGMGGLLQRVGFSIDPVEKNHSGTFALESHIRYLSEVLVGHRIEVHARVVGLSAKRYHVMQFMTNLDKRDVSATFEVVSSYIDLRHRRVAPLPDSIAEQFDRLLRQHERLNWVAPVCGTMAP